MLPHKKNYVPHKAFFNEQHQFLNKKAPNNFSPKIQINEDLRPKNY